MGLQRFTDKNFEKAEYDVGIKMYHFRITEQKTGGVGGAVPLAASEELMAIMQRYQVLRLEVFPTARYFLLNSQGSPLTYIQVFKSINR